MFKSCHRFFKVFSLDVIKKVQFWFYDKLQIIFLMLSFQQCLYDQHNFFCVNMVPVAEKKTWEDALDHCREKNTNLTSLLSLTESFMAQSEIKSSDYTEQVWIGLRYLGNSWMWVNGDPLPYEAWPNGDQDHINFKIQEELWIFLEKRKRFHIRTMTSPAKHRDR
uniref:C-type lectin domain-containing protein n=1 Tax=Xiphophorus couchianus TaxID=32473 RepID=A0A3B5M4B3_9TELE